MLYFFFLLIRLFSVQCLLGEIFILIHSFSQLHGFTCGIDDLVILPHYDIRRKEELEGDDVGEEAHCDFVKFKRGEIGEYVM